MKERNETGAPNGLLDIRRSLLELRERVVEGERKLMPPADGYSAGTYESARNLCHYIALRSEDLRPLQNRLAAWGLSSLGRSEAHVLGSLDALLALLDRVSPGPPTSSPPAETPEGTWDASRGMLDERATELFGPPPHDRSVRIMVTAPDEAARDYSLVRELLDAGMDCLRINCAQGGPEIWGPIIDNVRRAEAERGVSCRILMDLAGPRARTGAIEPGEPVVKVKPDRDTLGRVTRPAQLWLFPGSEHADPPFDVDAALPLPAPFLALLEAEDRLDFRDASGSKRSLRIVRRMGEGCIATLKQTSYITAGMVVRHVPALVEGNPQESRFGAIPPLEQRIVLREGDRLVLTRDQTPGRPGVVDSDGIAEVVARIPCVPPEVLDDVRTGDPIWFDDGRVGGVIECVGDDEAVVRVATVPPGGAKLAAQKGINLPESDLKISSLTARDIEILPFIAEHADLVGYSFVRTLADLEELYARLDELPGSSPGVILKVEALSAFRELPALLLRALRRPPVGIMIARGDLAVECGFERLAEVQEEILWLCEAAHLPVVWATQVLEGLAKRGLASRAEITDAAFGERAECVMLNKGPYIVETVLALSSILERMQEHHHKKYSLLRRLRVTDGILDAASGRETDPGS